MSKFAEPKTGYDLPAYEEFKPDRFDYTATPQTGLETIRDEIRARRESGDASHVNVKIEKGVYRFGGISFDSRDSNVTWYGEPGAVIIGGVMLNKSAFSPVEGEMRERLSEEAKDKVLVTDLKKAGLTADDWGRLNAIGAYSTAGKYDNGRVGLNAEVFCCDRRMRLARWPNEGWDRLWDVLDMGEPSEFPPQNYFPDWATKRNPRGGTYILSRETNKHIKNWKTMDDVWIYGYLRHDWADSSSPIKSLDPATGAICPEYVACFAVKPDAPFYFYNVFEELDVPGEYYIDRENGLLYLIPTSDDFTIEISVLRRPLIEAKDITGFTLAYVELKCCLADAVVIEGNGNTVRDCLISNVASYAIRINGYNNLVKGNEITGTGTGAVSLAGGDRNTLTPGNNIAEDNYVYDWAQVQEMYAPAFSLQGVGNICRHNEMRHAPHMAITYGGNDHVIEYNLIADCVRVSSDAGAIYSGYDWTAFGCRVNKNVLYNIGQGEFIPNGIYFDDAMSGQTSDGNLLVGIKGLGFLIGGGRSNTITNNVIADNGICAISYDDRARDGVVNDGWARAGYNSEESIAWKTLRATPFRSEIWAKKYPQLAAIRDNFDDFDDPYFPPNPQHAVVDNNIIFTDDDGGFERIYRGVRDYAERISNVRKRSSDLKLLFADPENGDWTPVDPQAEGLIEPGLAGRRKKK
ncbi:MAG: right-handed parallel beta-helix repeat-containing protein [Clostridiales bacterium]|nr:right-handed parallel beta-helix repeat-containing protein [Clostridiales bacterium]